MNKLLHLNKRFLISVLFFFGLISLVYLIYQQSKIIKTKVNINNPKLSFDLIDPKFTINNNKKKIAIKADQASFINKNEILLQNNVIFKSTNFTIKSNEVYFDKKKQSALSKKDSTFSSDGTNINAKGFIIKNGGEKIQFNGKTKIILSQ